MLFCVLAVVNSYMTPQYTATAAGLTIQIKCSQFSNRKPEWMFNHGPLNRNYPFTINAVTMRIKNVQLRHAGIYTCYMPGPWWRSHGFLAFGKLKVFGMLAISIVL